MSAPPRGCQGEGREAAPVDLCPPRVSGVGCRSRVIVLWCCGNPVIDRFSREGVISDQLLSVVWQVRNVAFNIQLKGTVFRMLKR